MYRMYYLLGCLLFLWVKGMELHQPYGDQKHDLVSGKIHIKFPRWREGVNDFPAMFIVYINVDGRSIKLSLTFNPRLSACVKVYPESDGWCRSAKNVDRFYQDPRYGASLLVKVSAGGHHNISGFFTLGHHHYHIQSVSRIMSIHHITRVPFLVSKKLINANLRSDYIVPDKSTLRYQQLPITHPTRLKRSGTVFRVELFLAIDYSIYKFWYDQNANIAGKGKRRLAAIADIRQYYSFLVNGVDGRYRHLPGTAHNIEIIFTGIYISETTMPWSGNPDIGNRIDAGSVLDKFQSWRESNLLDGSLPEHDHAMMFTRYNLAINNQTDTTGSAYISSICSKSSVSLVQENFDFISNTVAAHELGHSLGATHEGVGSNTCPDEGYVMSAVSRPRSTSINPWRFSSCSVTQMTEHINSLSSNCLLQEASARGTLGEHDPIGQKYTGDEQCRLSIGAASVICREFYDSSNYHEICTGLSCKSLYDTSCSPILPAETTTCGHQKWCQDGICTFNASSPGANDLCLFGDEPGTFCSQMKSSKPWGCYGNDYRKCCDTCESIRSVDDDCPFGDREDCSYLVYNYRSDCYKSTVNSNCCGTCKKLSSNILGCEFGDKAGCDPPDCSKQTAAEVCCSSCMNATKATTTTTFAPSKLTTNTQTSISDAFTSKINPITTPTTVSEISTSTKITATSTATASTTTASTVMPETTIGSSTTTTPKENFTTDASTMGTTTANLSMTTSYATITTQPTTLTTTTSKEPITSTAISSTTDATATIQTVKSSTIPNTMDTVSTPRDTVESSTTTNTEPTPRDTVKSSTTTKTEPTPRDTVKSSTTTGTASTPRDSVESSTRDTQPTTHDPIESSTTTKTEPTPRDTVESSTTTNTVSTSLDTVESSTSDTKLTTHIPIESSTTTNTESTPRDTVESSTTTKTEPTPRDTVESSTTTNTVSTSLDTVESSTSDTQLTTHIPIESSTTTNTESTPRDTVESSTTTNTEPTPRDTVESSTTTNTESTPRHTVESSTTTNTEPTPHNTIESSTTAETESTPRDTFKFSTTTNTDPSPHDTSSTTYIKSTSYDSIESSTATNTKPASRTTQPSIQTTGFNNTTVDKAIDVTPDSLLPGNEAPVTQEAWFIVLMAVIGVSVVLTIVLLLARRRHRSRTFCVEKYSLKDNNNVSGSFILKESHVETAK
ncbi:uncharacterized protein LOC111123643 isoform X2 [Crassostrea virginica]